VSSTNCVKPDVAEKVALYCEDHSTPLPQDIEHHKKFTRENFLDHDKMVSSLEVRSIPPLLSNFRLNCSFSSPRIVVPREVLSLSSSRKLTFLVLEIGCYSGYSALAWAEALKNTEGAEVRFLFI